MTINKNTLLSLWLWIPGLALAGIAVFLIEGIPLKQIAFNLAVVFGDHMGSVPSNPTTTSWIDAIWVMGLPMLLIAVAFRLYQKRSSWRIKLKEEQL